MGLPLMERWPEMSGKAWMATAVSGTPTKQSGDAQQEGGGDPAVDFFHGLGFTAVDEVVGAKGACFFFLVGGGGEGGYLRAEGACELDGQVAESADADDANPG